MQRGADLKQFKLQSGLSGSVGSQETLLYYIGFANVREATDENTIRNDWKMLLMLCLSLPEYSLEHFLSLNRNFCCCQKSQKERKKTFYSCSWQHILGFVFFRVFFFLTTEKREQNMENVVFINKDFHVNFLTKVTAWEKMDRVGCVKREKETPHKSTCYRNKELWLRITFLFFNWNSFVKYLWFHSLGRELSRLSRLTFLGRFSLK